MLVSFPRVPFSVSNPSPLTRSSFPTPAVRSLGMLSFPFSIIAKGHFLVFHVRCYFFRICQCPRLPFFFAPRYFCSIFCSHVYFCPLVPFLCFLLQCAQITTILAEFRTLSDEPCWGIQHSRLSFLPPCFYCPRVPQFAKIYF